MVTCIIRHHFCYITAMNLFIKCIIFCVMCLYSNQFLAQVQEQNSKLSFAVRGKWLLLPGWDNVSWISHHGCESSRDFAISVLHFIIIS